MNFVLHTNLHLLSRRSGKVIKNVIEKVKVKCGILVVEMNVMAITCLLMIIIKKMFEVVNLFHDELLIRSYFHG